jgi:branched-subunit amino acid permease
VAGAVHVDEPDVVKLTKKVVKVVGGGVVSVNVALVGQHCDLPRTTSVYVLEVISENVPGTTLTLSLLYAASVLALLYFVCWEASRFVFISILLYLNLLFEYYSHIQKVFETGALSY